MAISATMVIRRMRGGAQSRLISTVDGSLWVVKFQNNPQHLFVLANEFIATHIAASVGLSVPSTEIIEVTPWLYKNSVDLDMDVGRDGKERCSPGLHFGSRFIGSAAPGDTFDYLPEEQLEQVLNRKEFAGILAFDKWTGNCDGRQTVFSRDRKTKRYKANFIDQGFCFNAGDWSFPDSPLRGIFARKSVYAHVTGWESFSPWLERLEEFKPETLWEIMNGVPPEWYDYDTRALEKLGERLLKRRSRIRELILSFRNSELAPFPLWGKTPRVVVPNMAPDPAGTLDTPEGAHAIDSGLQIAQQ